MNLQNVKIATFCKAEPYRSSLFIITSIIASPNILNKSLYMNELSIILYFTTIPSLFTFSKTISS